MVENTRGDPRGSYARGRATRDEIVIAARHIMAQRGFHGATMGAIADRCGLTRAGVLHHFDSKEHLLATAMEWRYAENAAWYQAQVDAERNILDVAIDLMERHTKNPESATLLVVLAGASSEPGHPAHAWYHQRYAYLRRVMADHVSADQARGVVRRDLDPTVLAIQLVAMMEGLLLHWLNNRAAFDPIEAMRAYTRILRPN